LNIPKGKNEEEEKREGEREGETAPLLAVASVMVVGHWPATFRLACRQLISFSASNGGPGGCKTCKKKN